MGLKAYIQKFKQNPGHVLFDVICVFLGGIAVLFMLTHFMGCTHKKVTVCNPLFAGGGLQTPLSLSVLCPGDAPQTPQDASGEAIGPEGPAGVDGAPGVAGAAGSDGVDGIDAAPCTVERVDGGARISCPDGSTADVFDGTNGVDGSDGTDGVSCSVSVVSDTLVAIDCTDGTHAEVADGDAGTAGVDGEDGTDGVNGLTCSIDCDGQGHHAYITCGDATLELVGICVDTN